MAAPVSRPFAVPVVGGAEDVDSGDIFGDAVEDPEEVPSAPTEEDEESGEDEEQSATDELQESDSYRSAVEQTTDFARAYGTYSPGQTAEEWVETLPALDPKAKAQLLKSAKGTWSEVKIRESSSKATPVAESVAPIFSRDSGRTIQLSVSVTKKTSYEGEKGFASDSYAVTLKQSSGASGEWVVVAVS